MSDSEECFVTNKNVWYLYGILSQKKKAFQNLTSEKPFNFWCLGRESNSHGRKAHEILSLTRLVSKLFILLEIDNKK